jgi:hypothetical protein
MRKTKRFERSVDAVSTVHWNQVGTALSAKAELVREYTGLKRSGGKALLTDNIDRDAEVLVLDYEQVRSVEDCGPCYVD